MDADRGPGEVELVGDAGGDVVLLVGDHDLERADLLDEVGAGRHVALVVGRVVHARRRRRSAPGTLGRVAGALERLPADLQEEALLRVHELGLARVDAEEGRVEHSTSSRTPRARHVGRVVPVRARAIAGIERLRREEGDGLAALAEVPPELLDAGPRGTARPWPRSPRRPGSAGAVDGASRARAGALASPRRPCACAEGARARPAGVSGAGRTARRERRAHARCRRGRRLEDQQRVAAQLEEVVVARPRARCPAPPRRWTQWSSPPASRRRHVVGCADRGVPARARAGRGGRACRSG